jgi:DMSO/TMAO reductase YedYZ molybdopterin-dependent catalytic subunit
MTENQEQVLASLPVFPSGGGEGWRNLCVGGLVRYPLTFSQRDLERLPKAKLTQDFQCEEGWVVPDQRWEGPRVADLLELAKPLPGAKYVAFSAGEFTVGLSLEEIAQGGAVLAQKLNVSTVAPAGLWFRGRPAITVSSGWTGCKCWRSNRKRLAKR